ncbi:MAG: ATPase central domain protein [Myxococcales bacterium]|nr:ATPase central domain protein [Myxococcales bacterium]
MSSPYLDQAALVEDQLRVTRERLKLAANVDDEREVRARVIATTGLGIEMPITWLRDRLGLSESEERVVWTLVAHELCPEARRLIRELNTEQVSDATFDTLRRVLYGNETTLRTWRELGSEGPLRRLGLIERTDGMSDAPEQRQTFKVARRVLALVFGEVGIDPELVGVARFASARARLEELEVEPTTVVTVRNAMSQRAARLVIVYGRAGSGRRSLVTAIAREAGRQVMSIDAGVIATQRDQAQRQLRMISRECRLLACVPLIQNIEALAAAGDTADRFDLAQGEIDGLAFATSARMIARRWKSPVTQIEIPPQISAQRAKLWQRSLPQASEADAELLATMYPLAPALIHAAGEAARRQCGGDKMMPAHIEAGIRVVLDDRLAGLATRTTVTQRWEDLILPDDQVTAIVELLSRIRERKRVYEDWGFAAKLGKGLGVSALFSGPPGTGKSMAAGLIARDLGVEIYQVDLSKIVSKWIGETEKNLAALFDAAEAGHAVLLFDEADALFGKRTEVRSSNDRHANQEVNYLLQRLETFAGICILTTNHETAIDEAFRRRLSVHVRFPVPEIEERKRLWRALMPPAAPIARDLPVDKLAESFVMSGGYIRNAVLRAAFLAADENSSIGAMHVTRAATLEYEAMGKVVSSR